MNIIRERGIKITDLVTSSNDVALSNIELDLNEEKLFFISMAHFNRVTRFKSKEVIFDEDDYMTIHALDFGCILGGYDNNEQLSTEQLRNAEKIGVMALSRLGDENNNKIFTKIMKVKTIDREKTYIKRYPIITGIEYAKDDKLIKVRYAPEIYDFFKNNEANFNTFCLTHFGKIKSSYATKLYRYLNSQMFKSKAGQNCIVEVGIKELKFILNCEEKYDNSPQNFKDRVISVAIKHINEYTNLKVDFFPIKKSNKTVGYSFDFTHNSDYKILQRIKELEKEKKKAEKDNKAYFLDGSHFLVEDRNKHFIPLEKITEPQAKLLLSIDKFVSDYANIFNINGDNNEVKKKLKIKLLNSYIDFLDHPIDFDYYVWIKKNEDSGVTSEKLIELESSNGDL